MYVRGCAGTHCVKLRLLSNSQDLLACCDYSHCHDYWSILPVLIEGVNHPTEPFHKTPGDIPASSES